MISWLFWLDIELVFARVDPMPMRGSTGRLQLLREAIEGLSLAPDGDEIAEVRALASQLEAAIASAEAEYAATGGPEVDGYADMATFTRHRCRTTLPDSRRVARRATRMTAWPELAEAWRDGRVTAAQVDLACASIPDRHVERFARTVGDTIDAIAPLTAHQTGIVLRRWASHADDMAQREAAEAGIEAAELVPDREMSSSRTLDDELVVNGSFDAASAAVIEKALTAATRDDLPGERRTPKQRRADAFVEVCHGYLAGLASPDGNRRTERLTVSADVLVLYRAWLREVGVRTAADLEGFLASRPGLGELDRGLFREAFDGLGGVATSIDGSPVTDALVAAVASGGTMELLLTSGNRLLGLGRSTRTFSPAQRRAVLTRDGGCRSCGADPSRCEIHHVVPWEEGGCTDVGNAVALCRRCHRMLHRRRWANRIEPDGTYTVTLHDGTERTSRPPGLDDQLPLLRVATTSAPARTPTFVVADPPPEPPPPSGPECVAGFRVIRRPAIRSDRRHDRRSIRRLRSDIYGDLRLGSRWIDVVPRS
jgi:hypothetical protein